MWIIKIIKIIKIICLLTSSDTKRTLMHVFLFTHSVKLELVSTFNMYPEYTQPQLTFLALVPWPWATLNYIARKDDFRRFSWQKQAEIWKLSLAFQFQKNGWIIKFNKIKYLLFLGIFSLYIQNVLWVPLVYNIAQIKRLND